MGNLKSFKLDRFSPRLEYATGCMCVVVVWGARFSMLGCYLVEGVWCIYDRDTGCLVLMYWEVPTGFSCMSFTR